MGVLEQAQEALNNDINSIEKLKNRINSLKLLLQAMSNQADRPKYAFSMTVKAQSAGEAEDIEALVGLNSAMDLDFISGTIRKEISSLETMILVIESKYKKLLESNT